MLPIRHRRRAFDGPRSWAESYPLSALHYVRDVWNRVREPRHLKAIFFAYYLVAILAGTVTLLKPPSSVSGELGGFLTIVWSVFFLIGGTSAAVSVFPGWWWLERIGCWSTILGILIYASVVTALHFSQPGSRLTQLTLIALASGLFAIRLLMIRGYSFEPRG